MNIPRVAFGQGFIGALRPISEAKRGDIKGKTTFKKAQKEIAKDIKPKKAGQTKEQAAAAVVAAKAGKKPGSEKGAMGLKGLGKKIKKAQKTGGAGFKRAKRAKKGKK